MMLNVLNLMGHIFLYIPFTGRSVSACTFDSKPQTNILVKGMVCTLGEHQCDAGDGHVETVLQWSINRLAIIVSNRNF